MFSWIKSCLYFFIPLNPTAITAINTTKNDNAFQTPSSINIIARSPKVVLNAYKIATDCFCVKPCFINLWCKCPLSGLKTALKDFPFFILLKIANIVSNIGNPNTKTGATSTNSVTVFATPNIDITASVNPKNCDPTSPMNVFAGLILNGINPKIAPPKQAINITDTSGE